MALDLAKSPLNPQTLALADATRAFSAAGAGAMLQADIGAGAPVNADGTLNVVHYAAGLVREVARGS